METPVSNSSIVLYDAEMIFFRFHRGINLHFKLEYIKALTGYLDEKPIIYVTCLLFAKSAFSLYFR